MKQVGECVIVDFGARLGLEGGGGRGGGVLGRFALRRENSTSGEGNGDGERMSDT